MTTFHTFVNVHITNSAFALHVPQQYMGFHSIICKTEKMVVNVIAIKDMGWYSSCWKGIKCTTLIIFIISTALIRNFKSKGKC